MAAGKRLSIELEGKIVIDRKTSELCLKVVELYMNQNHVDILPDHDTHGNLSLRFDED